MRLSIRTLRVVSAILLFAVVAPASSLAAPDTAAERGPMKIGAILPLSGALGAMGTAARNGIEFALAQLPPDRRAKLSVVYEDDAFVPKNTLSAFQKLVAIDGVQAVIAWGSATSNSIAKLADEKGIVMLSISSDPRVSSSRASVFSLWVTPQAETAALLPEARRRGYRRLVRLTAIHDGALAAKSAFDVGAGDSFELVFDEDVNGENTDFRSILAKLKGQKFDAFLPLLFPEQLAAFARQAREMGFAQPFFGYELFEDENAVTLSNGALVGSWYATYDDPAQWFVTEYKKRFPGASLLSSANGYDAIKLLSLAQQSGRHSAAEISDFFKNTKDFEGAMGKYSAAGDNKFSLPATLKLVAKDGFPKL